MGVHSHLPLLSPPPLGDHTRIAPGPATATRPKKTDISTGCIVWGCLVPLVLFVGCFMYFAGEGQKQADIEKQYGSSTMASIMCEDYVKQRLNSPRSAKFPSFWTGEARIDSLGGGRYRVHSQVDAQNAFGALLRSQFVCSIAKVPGGDEWRLEDLTMER